MLNTQFLNYTLTSPIMNASGVHCTTTEELQNLADSAAGAIVTKSATKHFRVGNPHPRYADLPLGSINSTGLANNGFDYYLDYVSSNNLEGAKPLFFSVAGMTFEENLYMLNKIQASSFTGITELNLSCPNLPGKPQIAYDFPLTEQILTKIFSFFTKPLGVKLPPYFDLVHFDQMAKILNQFPLAFINSINSIGNGLYVDTAAETTVIKPKDGFGGIGGAYVKPTALANVNGFYQRLNPQIKIIGTGGVNSGQDVFEHLLCGAQIVQVGTALHREGPQIFSRLSNELADLMEQKGYQSIEDFRGKIKTS
ncbi:dihydroorotate oxidase [Enterococcus pseudoavium]|nr:dihydroorotate oxidase [Enterococcus pseudoavium]